MSDVSLELSGGRPQQLDSLISNSTWMGDTGRLRDFYLCTPRGGKSWRFYLGMHCWGPFQDNTVQEGRAQATTGQIHRHITQTVFSVCVVEKFLSVAPLQLKMCEMDFWD